MEQHGAAKRAYPGAIVFFRLGDFYEMFGEDAVLVSKLLELTLTSRNRGKPDEIPMAGVPHHAAHSYIARLLAMGHRVAICEQMADPAKTKGIVPREVVRVITPGLVTDADQLDASANNYLCAIELVSDGVGMALLDLSTGELRVARVGTLALLLGELSRSAPREILLGGATLDAEAQPAAINAARAILPGSSVREDPPLGPGEVEGALGALMSDAAPLLPEVLRATGRVLRFARACNPRAELPVRQIARWEPNELLVIDPTAQVHLELCDNASRDRKATLLGVIDLTVTPAGARLLRRRLLAPLLEVERIRRRQDEVELFADAPRLRQDLREALGGSG